MFSLYTKQIEMNGHYCYVHSYLCCPSVNQLLNKIVMNLFAMLHGDCHVFHGDDLFAKGTRATLACYGYQSTMGCDVEFKKYFQARGK